MRFLKRLKEFFFLIYKKLKRSLSFDLQVSPFIFPTVSNGNDVRPSASMVDNALAGNKNTELFAAVAIGSTIITSFAWVFNFLTHVPTQRISKSYALGDLSKVESNFHTALIFASALGLICSVLLFISMIGY